MSQHKHRQNPNQKTSWQQVGSWYDKLTGDRGHYYHKHVIMPGVYRLLGLRSGDAVLDLGCGQGVLERSIPRDVDYLGIDSAPFLIDRATEQVKNPKHQFLVADITRDLSKYLKKVRPSTSLKGQTFTHAAVILALQNVKDPESVIENAAKLLRPEGKLVIVLNHPAFRIPRHTSWGIDEKTKLQYRRVNRYMSSLEIPITAHPGKRNSSVTWSYHHPLSYYVDILSRHDFVIEKMDEWVSDKESVGTAAEMENRSRSEIPLFLAVSAVNAGQKTTKK